MRHVCVLLWCGLYQAANPIWALRKQEGLCCSRSTNDNRGWRRRPLQEMTGGVSGLQTSNRLPNQHDRLFYLPLLLFYFSAINRLKYLSSYLIFRLFVHRSVFLLYSSKSNHSFNLKSIHSVLRPSNRASIFRRSTRLKSMVVYCAVLPLSCPTTCPLHPWGRSRLLGAPSQVPGCVFGNKGMSCKLPSLFAVHIVFLT